VRLIFSRDRAAQLDLLLRSLDRHAGPGFTTILYHASSESFKRGYQIVEARYPEMLWRRDNPFDTSLRAALSLCSDSFVTLLCDDDVMFRDAQIPDELPEDVLCHSLRLDAPKDFLRAWRWGAFPRTDHGYPCSVDGHTFRVEDVFAMIGTEHVNGPTMLETIMDMRAESCARPLMLAELGRSIVGVPVNRVSPQSGCEYGVLHPQSARDVNDRWLRGESIVLDEEQFASVDACHAEIAFRWEQR